jgi:hypothetical protein
MTVPTLVSVLTGIFSSRESTEIPFFRLEPFTKLWALHSNIYS